MLIPPPRRLGRAARRAPSNGNASSVSRPHYARTCANARRRRVHARRKNKHPPATGTSDRFSAVALQQQTSGAMDRILIRGGRPLRGEIEISGSKNAALPLLAAALLTREKLRLSNLPRLADIASMRRLLETLGVELREVSAAAEENGMVLEVQADEVKSFRAPCGRGRWMRASVRVLGPRLARFGRAEVSLPGGCAIATRPVDLHLGALEAMGARITFAAGYIHAAAARGLRGADFAFPVVSV